MCSNPLSQLKIKFEESVLTISQLVKHVLEANKKKHFVFCDFFSVQYLAMFISNTPNFEKKNVYIFFSLQ